jgi:hypothetical protein
VNKGGQDWKRPAVLAAILLALVAYTLLRAVPERSSVDRLEAQLAGYPIVASRSGEAGRVSEYVRYYAQLKPRSDADLPFTSRSPGRIEFTSGRQLIVGVLVAPEVERQLSPRAARPGIRRVAAGSLPRVAQHGCQVVNVVYDPRRDEVLGAWCNTGGAAASPTVAAR